MDTCTNNQKRRRDRLRNFFGKGSAPPTTIIASPTQPTQTCIKDQCLSEALAQLTLTDQATIKTYITGDLDATIRAAYDAAKDQKAACERKRWSSSKRADRIIHWLERFKAVGDVVANADPIHVGLPWAGIRVLLEVAVADSRQMSALVDGMDVALYMINRLQTYFVHYRRLPPSSVAIRFREVLLALHACILGFLAKAIQVYSMPAAARKARALWQESEIKEFRDKCDMLGQRASAGADDCDRELYNSEQASALQWRKDLDATLNRLQERMDVASNTLSVKVDLSKLVMVGEATYDSYIEAEQSRCLPGTRSAVLSDIDNWAAQTDSKPIYWLCGQAGAGKSTISRTIAHSLDQQSCLGASFFFKRGEQNRGNAHYFISTITAQLTDMIQALKVPVAAALDQDSMLCDRGIQQQFERLLLNPILSVDPAYLPTGTVFLVVDALDECDRDTDICVFLGLLTRVKVETALRLHVLLTSRPELPVRLGFRKLDGSLHQDIILEEMQKLTIASDICTYFNHEFAKLRTEWRLEQPDDPLPADWPSDVDRQRLVSLAVPLFIYASTVCRFVSEGEPEARLRRILNEGFDSRLSQIAKLYLPILGQLLVDKTLKEREEILSRFRELVGVIVLAADPLSITSLAVLLQIERRAIRDRLKQLHSVLRIPEDSQQPVRLIHLSFRDFLIDQDRTDGNEFHVDEVETQRRLAHACLIRLKSPNGLKSDICCVSKPGIKRAELSTEQIARHITPDLAYACSYWPLHFLKGGQDLCDEDLVHSFLEQHLLHWLEVLSWLGRLSDAVAYLNGLSSVAQGPGSAGVSKFLRDAIRFLLRNRYVIDLAPMQIYSSAIYFTPTKSIVRQTFEGRLPRLLMPIANVAGEWSAEIQKLEGHSLWVTAVAFSPDGQTIASGSDDGTVRLWNAKTGEQRLSLDVHKNNVYSIIFSPDGLTLAAGLSNGIVKLWKASTGECQQEFAGQECQVKSLAFTAEGQMMASGSSDAVVLWDMNTNEPRHRLEGHQYSVVAMEFSPDGQTLTSASDRSEVILWNTMTGQQERILGEGSDYGASIALSPKVQMIAVSTEDRTVELWDGVTGMRTQDFAKHANRILAIVFSPDGKRVATASGDDAIRIWDVPTGEQRQVLAGHDGEIRAIAFSPDGQVIASTSRDCTVRLWDTARTEPALGLRGRTGQAINAVTLAPNGKIGASISHDRSYNDTVQLWDVEREQRTHSLEDHGGTIAAIAFSPNGQTIASASAEDYTVRLWSSVTGELQNLLDAHEENIVAMVFSPNGQTIATASRDEEVWIWDTETGEPRRVLRKVRHSVVGLKFSPRVDKILIACENRVVIMWNWTSGETRTVFSEDGSSWGMTLSADGLSLSKPGTPDVMFEHNMLSSSFSVENGRPRSLAIPQRVSSGACLGLEGPWIRHDDEDLLWLPVEYRGRCSASAGRSLMVAHVSGSVSFFRLPE